MFLADVNARDLKENGRKTLERYIYNHVQRCKERQKV